MPADAADARAAVFAAAAARCRHADILRAVHAAAMSLRVVFFDDATLHARLSIALLPSRHFLRFERHATIRRFHAML